MKAPDEIKKGLECCWKNRSDIGVSVCNDCPYLGKRTGQCKVELGLDALALIRQLEARERVLDEGCAALASIAGRLERERDAAVSELVGTCQVCRWEETAKCASCHFCEDAWNVHESNWEWRGVQKEE